LALRDLLVRFGIDVEGVQKLEITDDKLTIITKRAREAGAAFTSFGAQVKRVVAAYLGIQGIRLVKNFAADLVTQADQLQHNAERLGVTTDELQKYQYVAGLMQVSTKETAITLRFFNRAIGEASLGTKAANKTFNQLGVNIKDAHGDIRPTDELLFEVADKLKGVHSQATRTAYAMRLLGRNGAAMLPVLQKGSKELREAFKDVDELGGGFNAGFIQQAHETDVQLKRLKMGWRSVYVAILTEVLPVFMKWVDHSIKTVKHLIDLAKHTYFFRTALMALAASGVIAALTKLFGIFKIGKMGLKDILVLFVKYPLIAAFTAAIVALYLAFDDLYTFLKGGDSVLGRFLDSMGGAGTALEVWQELKKALEDVWEALKPASGALKDAGKSMMVAFIDSIPFIIKWGGIFTAFVIDKIDSAVTWLRQIGPALRGALGNIRGNDTTVDDAEVLRLETELNERKKRYEEVARAFDSISTRTVHAPRVQTPESSPGEEAPGVGTGTRVPGSTVIQITNNVTGAADAHATAKAVGAAPKGAGKSAMGQKRDTYNAVSAGQPVTGQ
jgi:hypothetical protein